jgi:hypothetical protein
MIYKPQIHIEPKIKIEKNEKEKALQHPPRGPA